MKVKPEHLEHMRAAMAPHDGAFHRDRYRAAGYSTQRYQWDLLRHAGLMPWVCNTLYMYCNDDHIQTALNRLVKPL